MKSKSLSRVLELEKRGRLIEAESSVRKYISKNNNVADKDLEYMYIAMLKIQAQKGNEEAFDRYFQLAQNIRFTENSLQRIHLVAISFYDESFDDAEKLEEYIESAMQKYSDFDFVIKYIEFLVNQGRIDDAEKALNVFSESNFKQYASKIDELRDKIKTLKVSNEETEKDESEENKGNEGNLDIDSSLLIIEDLIEKNELEEAEKILKNVENRFAKITARVKFLGGRLLDAKVAREKEKYKECFEKGLEKEANSYRANIENYGKEACEKYVSLVQEEMLPSDIVEPLMDRLLFYGQDETAEKFALKYLKKDVDLSWDEKQKLCILLSELYESHNDIDKATETIENVVEQVGEKALEDDSQEITFNIELLLKLGQLQILTGNFNEAINYFNKLKEKYGKHPELAKCISTILEDLENKLIGTVEFSEIDLNIIPDSEEKEGGDGIEPIPPIPPIPPSHGKYPEELSAIRRAEFLLRKGPEQVLLGMNHFSGYLAFPFKEQGIVILEPFFEKVTNPLKKRQMKELAKGDNRFIYDFMESIKELGIKESYDNATYIVPLDRWERYAIMSKKELRNEIANGNKNVMAISHFSSGDTPYWYREMSKILDYQAQIDFSKVSEIAENVTLPISEQPQIPIENNSVSALILIQSVQRKRHENVRRLSLLKFEEEKILKQIRVIEERENEIISEFMEDEEYVEKATSALESDAKIETDESDNIKLQKKEDSIEDKEEQESVEVLEEEADFSFEGMTREELEAIVKYGAERTSKKDKELNELLLKKKQLQEHYESILEQKEKTSEEIAKADEELENINEEYGEAN